MAVLPWSALYSDGGKPAVWVVDPQSGAVALRRIEIEVLREIRTSLFATDCGLESWW